MKIEFSFFFFLFFWTVESQQKYCWIKCLILFCVLGMTVNVLIVFKVKLLLKKNARFFSSNLNLIGYMILGLNTDWDALKLILKYLFLDTKKEEGKERRKRKRNICLAVPIFGSSLITVVHLAVAITKFLSLWTASSAWCIQPISPDRSWIILIHHLLH